MYIILYIYSNIGVSGRHPAATPAPAARACSTPPRLPSATDAWALLKHGG